MTLQLDVSEKPEFTEGHFIKMVEEDIIYVYQRYIARYTYKAETQRHDPVHRSCHAMACHP